MILDFIGPVFEKIEGSLKVRLGFSQNFEKYRVINFLYLGNVDYNFESSPTFFCPPLFCLHLKGYQNQPITSSKT